MFRTFYVFFCSSKLKNEESLVLDLLVPYKHRHGGPRHHRVVRDCQPAKYNNVTHEIYKSFFSDDVNLPVYERRMFSQSVGFLSWDQHRVSGSIITVIVICRGISIVSVAA